jgi:hypothetical protein
MRVSLLPILAAIALALAAPVANARLTDPPGSPAQDLRSGDAQDANAAKNAHSLQDIVKQHSDPQSAALAQERYYSSYGKAAPVSHTVSDDSSPWPAIGAGFGLIVIVAGAVAVAVRTRRRTVRVAV